MTTKVAINGLGRIGRAILKLVIDEPALELVAVNDLVDPENLAYLIRFDTACGRYPKSVAVESGDIVIAGRSLRTLSSRDPAALPWKELGVELVFECTGALTARGDLEKHIRAGARIVLLSAPTHDVSVATVVHGTNAADGTQNIISCASCTTLFRSLTPTLWIHECRVINASSRLDAGRTKQKVNHLQLMHHHNIKLEHLICQDRREPRTS